MAEEVPEIRFKDAVLLAKEIIRDGENENKPYDVSKSDLHEFRNNIEVFQKYVKKAKNSPEQVEKILANRLSKVTPENYELFKNRSAEFEKYFRRYEKEIVKTISKYIGSKWVENNITIYPFPGQLRMTSRAYPLLLKLRDDMNLNLYLLTHELCHRYVHENPELYDFSHAKSEINAEAFAEYITKEVMKEVLGQEEANLLHKKEMEIVTSRDMNLSSKMAESYQSKYDLRKGSVYEQYKKMGKN